jgi:phage gp16-like protein
MRYEMEAMAAAHEELGNIQTTYTESLKRFAKDLVPRLGRLDKRLAKLGEAMGTTGSPLGD